MKRNIEIISILATLIISAFLAFASIKLFKDYGLTLFILIPFILGFLPPYIVSNYKKLSRRRCYLLSFGALIIAVLLLLLFAVEGIICIFMASPLLILLVWLGSYLAYKNKFEKWLNSSESNAILILLCIAALSFDYSNKSSNLIPVKTKIIVNSSIENAWRNVVTFNKIEEPKDWVFKTGIAYPTDATIQGTGVGAIRFCNFSTGSFVEPITTWEEPNLLQFNVKEQPIPMTEYNPFWEIHPPHLDGYFKSFKGQFKLTKISEAKTEIEGTTWYSLDIYPQFYWKIWSNMIIHKIHNRVLQHIKLESENLKQDNKYQS